MYAPDEVGCVLWLGSGGEMLVPLEVHGSDLKSLDGDFSELLTVRGVNKRSCT